MKNILITIENGFSSRYIVRSGLVNSLSSKIDGQIYIAVPNVINFVESVNILMNNIKIIQQPLLPTLPFIRHKLLELINQIQIFGMPNDPKYSALWIKKYIFKNNSNKSFSRKFFILFLANIHSRFGVVRKLCKLIVCKYQTDKNFTKILTELKINEIVLDGISSLIPINTYWISSGKHLGIKTTTILTNWDHPTTRGHQTIESDKYLVWGNSMKEEMSKYQDLPSHKIKEVGSIIFDYYSNKAFLIHHNKHNYPNGQLNGNYILLLTNSPYFPHNFSIIKFVQSIIPNDKKLLVRLHPLYANITFEKEMDHHKNFEKKHKNITYIYPKSECRGLPGDMNMDEIQLSSLLVANSNMIITTMSTMVLDAIILNKSLINIAFDWKKGELIPQKMSLQDYRIHVNRVKDSSNIIHSRSKLEFKSMILKYLNNGQHFSNKKQNIHHLVVKQECGQIDGLVSERIVRHLIA